jgi:hypothetical protein
MILHDVCCSPACTFVVKKLGSDSFVEDWEIALFSALRPSWWPHFLGRSPFPH